MKSLSINRILITAFIFLSVAFLFSCQKENSLNNSNNAVSEQDAATYSDESAQADVPFEDDQRSDPRLRQVGHSKQDVIVSLGA